MIAMHTALYGTMDNDTCLILYKITLWFNFIGIAISESILLLRTAAVCSRSRITIVILSVYYVTWVIVGMVTTWYYLRTTRFTPPPNPSFGGCYLVPKNGVDALPKLLMLLVFELAVVILTIKTMSGNLRVGTPLLKVLYRDSVAFFLVLFAVTLSAIMAQQLGPPQLSILMSTPFRVAHGIICCRILLNLRQAAESSGVTQGQMSYNLVFATTPGEQSNTTGTTLHDLEVDGARGGKGDSVSRRTGSSLHDVELTTLG